MTWPWEGFNDGSVWAEADSEYLQVLCCLSFSQPSVFPKFICNIAQVQRYQGLSGGMPASRIPPLELIETGLEVFKFASVNAPVSIAMIIPLSVFPSRHIGIGNIQWGTFFRVYVIRKKYHVSVTPLQRPDGMVKVPDFPAELDAVQERKVLTGNGIEELGFGVTG